MAKAPKRKASAPGSGRAWREQRVRVWWRRWWRGRGGCCARLPLQRGHARVEEADEDVRATDHRREPGDDVHHLCVVREDCADVVAQQHEEAGHGDGDGDRRTHREVPHRARRDGRARAQVVADAHLRAGGEAVPVTARDDAIDATQRVRPHHVSWSRTAVP